MLEISSITLSGTIIIQLSVTINCSLTKIIQHPGPISEKNLKESPNEIHVYFHCL